MEKFKIIKLKNKKYTIICTKLSTFPEHEIVLCQSAIKDIFYKINDEVIKKEFYKEFPLLRGGSEAMICTRNKKRLELMIEKLENILLLKKLVRDF